jgi:inosose dehydratase
MFSRRALLQSCLAPAAMAIPARRSPIGFAIGTYGMKSMTPSDALRTIARIGYDGVEPCFIPGWPTDPAKMSAADRTALRNLIDETGLAVPAILETLSITGAPDKRASNIERLKLATALCNELAPSKPPVVDTIIGGKSSDWERMKQVIAAELGDWARVGEQNKTTVCFKPHAAQTVNSAERALWLLKQVGSPYIRVVYDYSHFFVEGFTLTDSLKELFRYIAFVSVKDAVGKPENHQYLLPGDGNTDYLEYFRLLKQLGYSGFVGVEVSAQIQQEPGYEPVPTAQLCYDRLAPVFERAGIERPRHRHS